jgi:hypothetical protein
MSQFNILRCPACGMTTELLVPVCTFAHFDNGVPVRYPAGELAYAAPVAGEEAFCPACNTAWAVVAEPVAGEDTSRSTYKEMVAAARIRFYERVADSKKGVGLPIGAAQQALFAMPKYGLITSTIGPRGERIWDPASERNSARGLRNQGR